MSTTVVQLGNTLRMDPWNNRFVIEYFTTNESYLKLKSSAEKSHLGTAMA